jgi:hypothetical protein
MQPGAGKTPDRFVLVFGNIWIVIQFALDVEAGRRALENEMGHHQKYDGQKMPNHDLAQGPAGTAKPGPPRFVPGLTQMD